VKVWVAIFVGVWKEERTGEEGRSQNWRRPVCGCFCKILKRGCCRQETREENSLGRV